MVTSLRRDHSAPPLYVQVAAILRQRFLSGDVHEGDPLPSEKALCAEFSIARGTLRQALRLLEEEGYLRREQGRGTFITLHGRPQTAPFNRHLAFIVPYVRDSSVSSILVGFQEVAEEAGFSVIFNHVNNDPHQQEEVIRKLVKQDVQGIALYPVNSDHVPPVDALVQAHYPIVMVDRYLRDLTTDCVMSDHFGGALLGTQHLLDCGHTRIGFINWLSSSISLEHRELGYQQALYERGIPFDADFICRIEGYPVAELTALKAYLSRDDRPTAIFAANDQIAIALYRAAAALGLSIPDDLAIVGFDNLDVSVHLDPPLTTVEQPFKQIGAKTAERVLARINGDRSPLQAITLSPHLIQRESVAAMTLSQP
ncbi:MAG: GntR family transcriptional regulator [Anaerolineae bacterium]|nr:GntR family transcriptional regulator [Anaerolineae bacterium]